MSATPSGTYAGDVTASAAGEALEGNPRATLVDVRTRAEWSFVGVPVLAGRSDGPVLIEWQAYPGMEVDPDFVTRLESELAARGVSAEEPLYFICRSGARSRSAAVAMTEAGHAECYNIAGGFEGRPDQHGHRGTVEGWKAEGLPWVQS